MNENKMGTMPIPKLVLNISIPIMLSMMVQSLYNIIDAVFVSQISEDAMSAVSLVGPMQNIMIATAWGSAIAINAILSKSLGAKETDNVTKVANHGLFIAFCSSAVFAVSVFFFAEPFYAMQISTDTAIYSYCIDYQVIICVFSLGLFGQNMTERLLQATGKTSLSMITQVVGAVINIILDPLLIHGYWIFPKLEVKGAAIATVIGQTCAFLLALWLQQKYNKEIRLNFKKFRPSLTLIKKIYVIAVPSILNLSVASVAGYFLNNFVLSYSSSALATYGICEKLRSFFFMPIGGLNSGLIPIMAYNYGAGNKKRVLNSLYFGMFVSFILLVLGACAFVFLPTQMLSFFNATDDMLAVGVPMMRAYAIYFMPVLFGYLFNSIAQGLGKSYYALIVSLVKQSSIIPIAYLLVTYGTMNQFWYSQFWSEIVTMISVFICFTILYKTVVVHIGSENKIVTKEKSKI